MPVVCGYQLQIFRCAVLSFHQINFSVQQMENITESHNCSKGSEPETLMNTHTTHLLHLRLRDSTEKKCRKIFRTRGPGYILWDYVFQKWQDSYSHDASTTGLSKQELNKNKPTDILMWTGEISWGSIPRQWTTGNQGMLREELVLARGEPHNWLFNTKQSPLK